LEKWSPVSLIEFTQSKGEKISVSAIVHSAALFGSQSKCVYNTKENHKMKKLVRRFLDDDSGATAIEYGLIAAGISVAIIAVVNGLGTKLNTTFSSISSQLK
jgi:pilus assembly protein Flp/PilA